MRPGSSACAQASSSGRACRERNLRMRRQWLRMDNEFESLRGYLFGIAYRMLASVSDAEDIVQDAYLRYASTSRDSMRSVRAFLTTIVTRLCLNQLQSARTRRETYVGSWLPEPYRTDFGG